MKELEHFLATAPVKKFRKGEILIHQDQKLEHVYIVKKGAVRCYDISLDGSEQLIGLLAQSEIFPISLLLGIEERVQFFHSAFVDTALYEIDKEELVTFLKTSPDILFKVCVEIARKLSDLHYRVNAVGKPKAREKILHTLAFIADRFKPCCKQDKPVKLSLPLTHQDIANLVGLTRETTAATLKHLKDEGFIDYDKQQFFVYREKIEKTLW